ncbi:unnamed protein product, partial [Lactuca virosa]
MYQHPDMMTPCVDPQGQPLDPSKIQDHFELDLAVFAYYAIRLMTSEFLVGKLAMGSIDIQRQAAYELRLLAKTGMDNWRLISEAGAIPLLVTLLSSHDPRIQEHAVTTLLNLSIFENNKVLIVAAEVIDNIVDVLGSGRTMEARENVATTLFSLSLIDDYKVVIGSRPKSIPNFIGLLKDGTTTGKRDASTALINLAVYSEQVEEHINGNSKNWVALIVQELKINQASQCPHIVVCYHSFYHNGAISLVFEYMDRGSFTDVIRQLKTILEPYLVVLCKQ